MTAARRFFYTEITPGAITDLAELGDDAKTLEEAYRGVERIKSRRDDGDPKSGRLSGCYSHAFKANPLDKARSGRIVYKVDGLTIRILAVHPDHDEAYRRARARIKRLG